MKKLLCICALGVLCIAFPLAAKADVLDMGKFTCADFLKLDGDEAGMLYFWMDGYVSHKTGNYVLNSEAVAGDMRVLMEHCQKNPNTKLLDIFNN